MRIQLSCQDLDWYWNLEPIDLLIHDDDDDDHVRHSYYLEVVDKIVSDV